MGCLKALAGVILALSMNHAAIAANITIVKDGWGEQIIDISGKIEKGDALKIKQLSSELMLSLPNYKLKGPHYHLNTGGGDIDEAIQIGRFFREILSSVDSQLEPDHALVALARRSALGRVGAIQKRVSSWWPNLFHDRR